MQRVHQTHGHWLNNKNMNTTQGLIISVVNVIFPLNERQMMAMINLHVKKEEMRHTFQLYFIIFIHHYRINILNQFIFSVFILVLIILQSVMLFFISISLYFIFSSFSTSTHLILVSCQGQIFVKVKLNLYNILFYLTFISISENNLTVLANNNNTVTIR